MKISSIPTTNYNTANIAKNDYRQAFTSTSTMATIHPYGLAKSLKANKLGFLPLPHRLAASSVKFLEELKKCATLEELKDFLFALDAKKNTTLHRVCGAFVNSSERLGDSSKLVTEIQRLVAPTPFEIELLMTKNKGGELAVKYADGKTKDVIVDWVLDAVSDLKDKSSDCKENRKALKLLHSYWDYIGDEYKIPLQNEILDTLAQKSLASRIGQAVRNRIVTLRAVASAFRKTDVDIA